MLLVSSSSRRAPFLGPGPFKMTTPDSEPHPPAPLTPGSGARWLNAPAQGGAWWQPLAGTPSASPQTCTHRQEQLHAGSVDSGGQGPPAPRDREGPEPGNGRGLLPLSRCEVIYGPVERSHLYCVLATCERGFLVFKPSTDPEKAAGCSGETCRCCVSRGSHRQRWRCGLHPPSPPPRGRHLERSWLVLAQCHLAWSVTLCPRCPSATGSLSVTAQWHGLGSPVPCRSEVASGQPGPVLVLREEVLRTSL